MIAASEGDATEQSSTRDNGSDDESFDFTEHLAHRLGLARDAALAVLGEWLTLHKPAVQRVINVLEVCSHSHASHDPALSAG